MRSSQQRGLCAARGAGQDAHVPRTVLLHPNISNANIEYGTDQGARATAISRPKDLMGGRLGIRRVALWTVAGLVLAGAAFALLAYEREMAPVARPDPASSHKALLERGRVS